MNQIRVFLLGLLAVVGALFSAYLGGRKAGRKAEESKQLQLDLATERKKNETLETVAEVHTQVSALPDADVDRRLRDKYQRD